MDDVEDILEAFGDIDDIVEEVFEPDDLFEDFHEEPLKIAAAILAAIGAVFTVLMVLVLLVILSFRFGFFLVVASLAVFGVLVTVIAVGVFLSARTDVPHRVQRKINRARASSEDRSSDARTSEEEAIERLRDQYAEGEMTVEEFEVAVEEVIQSEDPATVVREYERE